jgi:predicted RNase H-like HicB family nuclease
MTRYIAVVDGREGAFGVTVPDLPGCVAMGARYDEAILHAVDAVRDWVAVAEDKGWRVPPPGSVAAVCAHDHVRDALAKGAATLTSIPLVRHSGRPAKANISIDSGTLAAIDDEAKRRKLTRSALIELLAREALPKMG